VRAIEPVRRRTLIYPGHGHVVGVARGHLLTRFGSPTARERSAVFAECAGKPSPEPGMLDRITPDLPTIRQGIVFEVGVNERRECLVRGIVPHNLHAPDPDPPYAKLAPLLHEEAAG